MFSATIIEKLTLVAPLGLCFHDAATGERVFDGLSVSVYPAAQTIHKKKSTAFPNRSGVYVLHTAAGLEEFARGAGDADFWKKNPPEKPYIAEVRDRENRFQPFQFTLKLPVRGIYRWDNGGAVSPNQNFPSIPLYSAPARPVSGGMSVIRAELRENAEKAASFAVLEARLDGNLIARGIADRAGRIGLMFPALSPLSDPLSSPPSDSVRVPLADQQWNLALTVKYEPQILQTSPPSEGDVDALPDLRLVLAQASGRLWANAEKTETFTTAVLQTGKELILRSREAQSLSSPPEETAFTSYLFVSPA